ncbi:hypothetical protein RclHR1_04130019 [Rhizophagus clarus]|uniref:Uncharacterized protein n=1 Tax=Rhizophagus clarus TaxID=94130 RepID=A0A2Z6RJN1_9GLOM|nr:hypothetical protein RclHR1_04130019 [Rhizophagus clarus]
MSSDSPRFWKKYSNQTWIDCESLKFGSLGTAGCLDLNHSFQSFRVTTTNRSDKNCDLESYYDINLVSKCAQKIRYNHSEIVILCYYSVCLCFSRIGNIVKVVKKQKIGEETEDTNKRLLKF